MKIHSPFLFKLASLLTTSAVSRWMSTIEYRALFYDSSVDPAAADCQGQKIYLFWHEYILFPFAVRGHCNLAMLLSRHSDAELLSYSARYMGFDVVRGSTNRGGAQALRELLRRSQRMHLAITPDGPRGPRRVLSPGPIYLASRLGLPLVLMGIGVDRPWRLGSWDRFAIPRLGSRVRGVISPEVYLPGDLDRAGIEHYRQQVERTLNGLCDEAEDWATSGARRHGSLPIRRQPAQNRRRRIDRTHAAPAPHSAQARANARSVSG